MVNVQTWVHVLTMSIKIRLSHICVKIHNISLEQDYSKIHVTPPVTQLKSFVGWASRGTEQSHNVTRLNLKVKNTPETLTTSATACIIILMSSLNSGLSHYVTLFWTGLGVHNKFLFHLETVKPRNVYHDQRLLRYKKPIRLTNASD